MKAETKTFSKKQIEELKGYVAISTQLTRSFIFIVIVFLIGWLLNITQVTLLTTEYPVWLLLTVIMGIFIYKKSAKWTGGKNLRKLIKQDISNGYCNMLIIETSSIIEIEELEDEGPSYIIDTVEGESILITGQFLGEYKLKKFPWNKFSILEAPKSKIFFGIKKLGEPISVNETRKPLSYDSAKQLGCFEKNYIMLDANKMKLLRL